MRNGERKCLCVEKKSSSFRELRCALKWVSLSFSHDVKRERNISKLDSQKTVSWIKVWLTAGFDSHIRRASNCGQIIFCLGLNAIELHPFLKQARVAYQVIILFMRTLKVLFVFFNVASWGNVNEWFGFRNLALGNYGSPCHKHNWNYFCEWPFPWTMVVKVPWQ